MQLAIVMARKGDVICAHLCGDLYMAEGGGLEHHWSRLEVLSDLNADFVEALKKHQADKLPA